MKREVMLAVGAVAITAVGCGGGPTNPGGSGQTTPGGEPGGASVQQATQRCEQGVKSAPQLSSDTKSKLEAFCAEAAKGDEKAARDATKQVCEAIVKEKVSSGPARQQALDSCESTP
jgi:hypothetical protein